MAYIVQRKDRFYVVDYDGIDPITGRERPRWRLVGCDRAEAEELMARLDAGRADADPHRSSWPQSQEFRTDDRDHLGSRFGSAAAEDLSDFSPWRHP